MRYLVGVQELLESRRFDFDLKLDFVLFFELVSVSEASEAAAVEAVVAEAAEQSRTRLALDCEVVEEASMVLLSDELVALPSSLSEAESPAAAAAVDAAAAAATAEAIEAAAEAVGVEGRWPSLRLRISGLSDTVLIFNFPSSMESSIRLPLSEVSNSSPLQEKKNRKLHQVHRKPSGCP